MGNARRIKNEKNKPINQEELKLLIEECKLEYPSIPEILLHVACIDYLTPKNGKSTLNTTNFDDMRKEILEQKGSMNIE
jgi:hypothetical protein